MASQFSVAEHHKQAGTEFGAANDHRPMLMWKGDHSLCELGHATGLCRSIKAWMLKDDGSLIPTTWDRPTNRRFSVTVHYETPGHEKEDEPLWQAKGYRMAAESARALPVPDIIKKIRELGAEAFKLGVDRDKHTTIAEKRAEIDAWLDRFDKANAEMLSKSEKRVAAILEAEKEERDAAAIKAAAAAGLTVTKARSTRGGA